MRFRMQDWSGNPKLKDPPVYFMGLNPETGEFEEQLQEPFSPCCGDSDPEHTRAHEEFMLTFNPEERVGSPPPDKYWFDSIDSGPDWVTWDWPLGDDIEEEKALLAASEPAPQILQADAVPSAAVQPTQGQRLHFDDNWNQVPRVAVSSDRRTATFVFAWRNPGQRKDRLAVIALQRTDFADRADVLLAGCINCPCGSSPDVFEELQGLRATTQCVSRTDGQILMCPCAEQVLHFWGQGNPLQLFDVGPTTGGAPFVSKEMSLRGKYYKAVQLGTGLASWGVVNLRTWRCTTCSASNRPCGHVARLSPSTAGGTSSSVKRK